jgi:hypothetical protein
MRQPPCILSAVSDTIRGQQDGLFAFPHPSQLANLLGFHPLARIHNDHCGQRTQQLGHFYTAPSLDPHSVVDILLQQGWTTRQLETLPMSIALPLREALRHCQWHPHYDWPSEAYTLIGKYLIRVIN